MPVFLTALINLLFPIAVKAVEEKLTAKLEPEDTVTKAQVAKETVKQVAVGSFKSKTMWLGFIVAILGVVQQYQDIFTTYLPAGKAGIFIAVLGAVIMVLRTLTEDNITDKAAPKE